MFEQLDHLIEALQTLIDAPHDTRVFGTDNKFKPGVMVRVFGTDNKFKPGLMVAVLVAQNLIDKEEGKG